MNEQATYIRATALADDLIDEGLQSGQLEEFRTDARGEKFYKLNGGTGLDDLAPVSTSPESPGFTAKFRVWLGSWLGGSDD